MIRNVYASGAIIVIAAVSANAALVPLDYVNPGDGLVTYDDASGLEWLDISETLAVTVNEVLTGYGGLLDSNFRYATTDDVLTLFTANGLIITGYGQSTPDGYDDMVNLVALLGGETDHGFSRTIHGLTGEINSQGSHRHIYFGYYYGVGDGLEYWINPGYLSTPPVQSISNVGSFLVRDHEAVPEPGAIWLFCASITQLVATKRSRTLPT